MKVLAMLLPLLGLVAAQNFAGQGAGRQQNDPFFNDFGAGTSSRTAAPWAAPPRQAAPGHVGGNNFGRSHSSTSSPNHPAIPFGDPQLTNYNPYANANPNAQGGNSQGLAGFGDADGFHTQLEANAHRPGGAPGTRGRSSGEQAYGGGGGGGGGGNAIPFGPGLIAGGGLNANGMQDKSDSNKVTSAAASASTVVGVVVAVLIVIGIFALVAVFVVRQRRQSRVVIGSV